MKIKATTNKITEKIPSLEEVKKNKNKRIVKHIVDSIIALVHNALCIGSDFIDFPFAVYNKEEEKLLADIMQQFADKDYKIEKIANIPQNYSTSKGPMTSHVVVHRIDLREAVVESKLKFHDKMKISKKSALAGEK